MRNSVIITLGLTLLALCPRGAGAQQAETRPQEQQQPAADTGEQPAAEPEPTPPPEPPASAPPSPSPQQAPAEPPPQAAEQQYGYPAEPPPGQSYRETYSLEGGDANRGGGYEEGGAPNDDPAEYGGEKSSFKMPPIGIRLDPFNWLIEGRLGLELEVGIWKFISFEMVPIFVVNSKPPSFNLSGREDNLSQYSNGLGMISGTSLGPGFWLSGKPLKGYVIRAIFTNYGYRYKSTSRDWGTIDSVEFTERRLYAYFGSHSVWGPVTLAGGIGLGVELNQQQRCFPVSGGRADKRDAVTEGCPDDGEQHIALDVADDDRYDVTTVADINGLLHPVYLMARFSLGLYLNFDD